MKSILNQLDKYQPEIKKIKQISISSHEDYDLFEVLKRITVPKTPIDSFNSTVTKAYKLLQNGYSISTLVDILYPLSVDVAYYLFYRHGLMISSESIIDIEMLNFVNRVSYEEYMSKLASSITDVSKKLFLARILQASCTAGRNINSLPEQFRFAASKQLSCQPTIKDAVSILDSIQPKSDISDIIVARMAYIAFGTGFLKIKTNNWLKLKYYN